MMDQSLRTLENLTFTQFTARVHVCLTMAAGAQSSTRKPYISEVARWIYFPSQLAVVAYYKPFHYSSSL